MDVTPTVDMKTESLSKTDSNLSSLNFSKTEFKQVLREDITFIGETDSQHKIGRNNRADRLLKELRRGTANDEV